MANPTIRTLGERVGTHDTPGFAYEDELGGGGGGGGVSDGNKGDLTVSGGGTNWQLNANSVGSAEIAPLAVGASEIADNSISVDHLASDVDDLIAEKVPQTRTVTTTAPLTGGGDLTTNRSIGLALQTDGITVAGAGTVASPLSVIGGGAAGIVGGGVWARPVTPHAYDDEFDVGTSLAAAWAVTSGSLDAVNPINPYSAFASGGVRYSHNTRRRDWLMLQPDASGTQTTITKAIPGMPTDFAVWMHGCYSHRTAAAINNDFTFGFTLSADPYDANNEIILFLNESDGGVIQLEFLKRVAGVVTSIGVSLNLSASDHTPFEGVLMQKIGTTYHGWGITNNGSRLHLGSTTFATTIGRVGFFL